MWETIQEYGLELEIKNMWTPKTIYSNDSNIMETAIQSNKFQGKHKWKLEIINNCRLYLQCFYIGDLQNATGQIPIGYLNGTTQRQNPDLHMEMRRRPPDPAWSVWKEFIIGQFLAGQYSVNPPLQKKIPKSFRFKYPHLKERQYKC